MANVVRHSVCDDPGLCTGCLLCVSVCPRQCIQLSRGPLGHLYPSIDATRCIGCDMCAKSCHVNLPVPKKSVHKAFAAWSTNDDVYMASSSGGVATILALHVVQNGGVVYGCAMMPGVKVAHVRVDSVADLKRLQGSKYVQSDLSAIWDPLQSDVKSGRKVLFVGLPCHVAAVQKLYVSQPDNLLLVDLVCHGAPSLDLLRSHVSHVANGVQDHIVVFRDGPQIGFKVRSASAEDVYSSILSAQRYSDWYINTFFDGYTYRDCCYHCNYACPSRVSDLTIGDFWGHKLPDGVAPKHGCSLIIPVTDRGRALVCDVASMLHLYEQDVHDAIAGNAQLRAPSRKPWRVAFFRKMMSCASFFKWVYWLVEADHIAIHKYCKYKRTLKSWVKK